MVCYQEARKKPERTQNNKNRKKNKLEQGLKARFPISLFIFQVEEVVSTSYGINSPVQAFLHFAFCVFPLHKPQIHNSEVASFEWYIKQEDKIEHLFPTTCPQPVFQFLSSHFNPASSSVQFKRWLQNISVSTRQEAAWEQNLLLPPELPELDHPGGGDPQNLKAACLKRRWSLGSSNREHLATGCC